MQIERLSFLSSSRLRASTRQDLDIHVSWVSFPLFFPFTLLGELNRFVESCQ